MARKTRWVVGGQEVVTSDVRLWMETVCRHIRPAHRAYYVKHSGVIEKIARHKAAGTFDALIQHEIAQFGLTVRKARTLGMLGRLQKTWRAAANDHQIGSAAGQAAEVARGRG